jgi:hypothetical protein
VATGAGVIDTGTFRITPIWHCRHIHRIGQREY